MSTVSLSVATVIEKNKIFSDTAFVLLFEIDVVDLSGNPVETVYICKNSTNIAYKGNEYIASNFSVQLDQDTQSEPKLQLTMEDPSGVVRDQMQVYGGGIGFNTTLTVVNTGDLTQPPEMAMNFKVISATQNNYQVQFTLGIDNPIAYRFPMRLMYHDQCTYIYKGARCKYSGSLTTCDFSMNGANGCVVHSNVANFGGFPGLQNLNA